MSSDQVSLPPEMKKAILSVPSLIVPIWAVYGGLELLVEMVNGQFPVMVTKTFQIITASFLGIILYSIGDFWDSMIFDKLYSVRHEKAKNGTSTIAIEGHWLQSTQRPFGVYPAGAPLKKARDDFVQKYQTVLGKDGQGSYQKAKKLLENAKMWTQVENPLLISKFVRSFIWPLVLISICFGGLFLWNLVHTQKWMSYSILIFFSALIIAVLATIPYFKFRVEHMHRLYEEAVSLTTKN